MLYTIAMILLCLWLLGFVSAYTMGGLIHVVLAAALALFIIGFVQNKRRQS